MLEAFDMSREADALSAGVANEFSSKLASVSRVDG